MSTQEVTKYSVYDPRVVQTKPKYAVEKGALSLTNVSFNAQTASTTTQQFNVIVPSENVFIDRAVEWINSGIARIQIVLSAAPTTGCPILNYEDISLAAFPSHQCVNQMTATINDATVTVNTQDVLSQVLRLQDLSRHRAQRTCPTMLDRYAYNYPVSSISTVVPQILNSPLADYGECQGIDQQTNGAWSQFYFCDSAGLPLTSSTGNASPWGLPLSEASGPSATQNVFVRWQTAEHLLLPPFIFGDDFELSTGLFGVQNFQVQMNMASTPQRALRLANNVIGRTVGGATINSATITWSTGGVTAGYAVTPALSVQFLTPALDVPLPPKSIVPYMEFPRYITTGLAEIKSTLGLGRTSAGRTSSATTIQSNTITLPNIPDLLMIYLKPTTPAVTLFTASAYGSAQSGVATPATGALTFDSVINDFVLPIESISINFDNFSGLLSNMTQYQLYKMSYNNGVNMDFNTWSGESRARSSNSVALTQAGNATGSPYLSLAGGPLVLRPGRDFALQAGQAPGLVGNFSLQMNLTVGNQFHQTLSAGSVALYVVPISSGFFETIKGSSRIIKGVLTEQDILGSAPAAPAADGIERPVGAGSGRVARRLGQMAMSQYRQK
jgi:hypothetical protein